MKKIGDVRYGYVESAHARFEVFGDREKTLEAMRSSGRRPVIMIETTIPMLHETVENFAYFNTIHGLGVVAAKFIQPKQLS